MSNFPNYAGGLTETMLLGNLAVWAAATGKGQRVEWDAKNLAFHQRRRPGNDRQAALSPRLYARRVIDCAKSHVQVLTLWCRLDS